MVSQKFKFLKKLWRCCASAASYDIGASYAISKEDFSTIVLLEVAIAAGHDIDNMSWPAMQCHI